MSKLTQLRNQLAALKRARTMVRWGAGYAALGIAVLWLLAAILLLDVVFEMNVAQRAVVLAVAIGATIWAFTRFTRPFLGVRETELDMALLVEKQQGIDSDLVAAIQFEAPEAKRWGSAQLETAVIDYVADVGRGINVFQGFSRRQLTSRATTLGVTLLVAVVAAALFPNYARVFWNRLCLGSKHYPTNTQIDHVLVNHQHVLSHDRNDTAPDSIKAAQSRPIQFLVRCRGALPDAGEAKLRSGASGQNRRLELTKLSLDERLARLQTGAARLKEVLADPDAPLSGAWRNDVLALIKLDASPAAASLVKSDDGRQFIQEAADSLTGTIEAWPASAEESAVYAGELGRLVDSVYYKLYLGDAWTDPAGITMIPLPAVEPQLTVEPPAYARRADHVPQPGARQLSVLESSAVHVGVKCTNGKRLASAWLLVRDKEGAKRFELAKEDEKGRSWKLPHDTADSPFTRVTREVRFEIQVADEDGLQLESPIQGFLRIRPDRAPTGTAEVVHRVVLPIARPVIEYRANDDYGLAEVKLRVQVERTVVETANTSSPPGTISTPFGDLPAASTTPANSALSEKETPNEDHIVTLLAAGKPLGSDRLPLVGKHPLDLRPWNLQKGDRLKITLEIRDYRGDRDGETYLSDPLYLEISDESGVFAAILEADERSEQRLSDIIKRQLGIGTAE